MRCFFAAFILLALAAPLSADERIEMRVLYCGDPGSAREADFRSFLENHFTKVTVGDLSKFKEEQARGQDVVVVDWSPHYDDEGGIDDEKWQRLKDAAPNLSREFARPTILVGAAGGWVAKKLDCKIDWLCLCLSDKAHKLAIDHVVFHAPLEVNPQSEEISADEIYPFPNIDSSITSRMTVWSVQTKNYPEVQPGLVSTLYGFADSPDAEVIGQGIAAKGPDTVALGRQANLFLWGFSAPPTDMTPAGRRLFVNVAAYMRQFDGQTPLVRPKARSREWALRYATIPRELTDDRYRQADERYLEKQLAKHPNWIPKKYNGDAKAYLAADLNKPNKAVNSEMTTRLLPAALKKAFGLDADKYVAYYSENLEYLRPEGDGTNMFGAFEVDEDAKAIKSSNRRIETLDRCVSMLEKSDRPELALRLLKRYTDESFDTPGQWRGWLDKNRNRMFFSDVGGYRFFLDTRPVQADKKQ